MAISTWLIIGGLGILVLTWLVIAIFQTSWGSWKKDEKKKVKES